MQNSTFVTHFKIMGKIYKPNKMIYISFYRIAGQWISAPVDKFWASLHVIIGSLVFSSPYMHVSFLVTDISLLYIAMTKKY